MGQFVSSRTSEPIYYTTPRRKENKSEMRSISCYVHIFSSDLDLFVCWFRSWIKNSQDDNLPPHIKTNPLVVISIPVPTIQWNRKSKCNKRTTSAFLGSRLLCEMTKGLVYGMTEKWTKSLTSMSSNKNGVVVFCLS